MIRLTVGEDEEGAYLHDECPYTEDELEFIGQKVVKPQFGKHVVESYSTDPKRLATGGIQRGPAKSRVEAVFRPNASDEEKHAIMFHAVAQYASLLVVSTECKSIEMQRALQAAHDRAEQLLEQLGIATLAGAGNMIDKMKTLWTNNEFKKRFQRNRQFLWQSVKPIADSDAFHIVKKDVKTNAVDDKLLGKQAVPEPATLTQKAHLGAFSDQKWYEAFKAVFLSSADVGSKTNERLIFYMIMIGVYTFEHNYRQAVRMTDLGYWESVPSDSSQESVVSLSPVIPSTKPAVLPLGGPAKTKAATSSAASSSSASSSGSSSKPLPVLSYQLPQPPIVGAYPAPVYSSSQGSGGAAAYPSSVGSSGVGGYSGGRGSAASGFPSGQGSVGPSSAFGPGPAYATKPAFGRFLSDM
jgi:hypothetical protein